MYKDVEAEIIRSIAESVVALTKPYSDGALLHAEAGDNWVAPSIFRDEGSIMRYVHEIHDITRPILELWGIAEEGKRWSGLVMTIQGNSFDAQFDYGEDWDPEEWPENRRQRFLATRYGNKKIVYPDIDEIDAVSRGGA